MKNELSKRDQFAAMVMNGFCANPAWDEYDSANIVAVAVSYADELIAELDRTALKEEKPTPDADGWIPHKPGDPMPCNGSLTVITLLRSGHVHIPYRADQFDWTAGKYTQSGALDILGWKPA